MGLLKRMTGFEVEHIPNIQFRFMSCVLAIRDILLPVGKRLDRFGIEMGFVVVDFGCGPGSFVERASAVSGQQSARGKPT